MKYSSIINHTVKYSSVITIEWTKILLLFFETNEKRTEQRMTKTKITTKTGFQRPQTTIEEVVFQNCEFNAELNFQDGTTGTLLALATTKRVQVLYNTITQFNTGVLVPQDT